MKNITVFTLIAIFTLTMFACAQSEDVKKSDVDTLTDDELTISAETEPDLYADLPIDNYDGYNFRILNNESNFALTQMDSSEQNGEPINDAIYDRNRLVEERLNIKITENMLTYSEVTSTITKAIAAGEDAYDIFFNESYFVAPLALENYLVNVYEVDAFDFNKPWWNADMIKSLSIGDKLYILAGDIHLMLNEATWVMAFNKRIVNNLNFESPYDIVTGGNWTLDKQIEMSHNAVSDLNGDGEMSADIDQFGGTLYINPTPIMISAGVDFLGKDSNNLPVYSGLTERDFSVYTKIVENIYSSGDYAIRGKTKGVPDNDFWTDVFKQGNALFLIEPNGSLKRLRDMEDEFGIIPFAKYDESQINYRSLVAHYSAVMGVPATNTNLNRTGVILEQLGALSHKDMRSVYFDIILTGKYSRDNESEKMLDLIFETRIFDLMSVYRWGNLIDTLNSQANSLKTDIVSAVEAVRPTVESAIEKTISFYSSLS